MLGWVVVRLVKVGAERCWVFVFDVIQVGPESFTQFSLCLSYVLDVAPGACGQVDDVFCCASRLVGGYFVLFVGCC